MDGPSARGSTFHFPCKIDRAEPVVQLVQLVLVPMNQTSMIPGMESESLLFSLLSVEGVHWRKFIFPRGQNIHLQRVPRYRHSGLIDRVPWTPVESRVYQHGSWILDHDPCWDWTGATSLVGVVYFCRSDPSLSTTYSVLYSLGLWLLLFLFFFFLLNFCIFLFSYFSFLSFPPSPPWSCIPTPPLTVAN